MEIVGVTRGQTARDTVDKTRILRAEKSAEANCKEAAILHSALKADENNFEEAE
ncbi:hypothetical protein TNCV_3989611, partial [Trichonephila clavipes]